MENTKPKDDFSIIELIENSKKIYKYYSTKKKYILIFLLGGALLGFVASLLYHPKYVSNLSFAIEESESGGGISSLASQFGISLGGGSAGAFGGDNIYELFGSKYIVRKVLLSPITIDNRTDNLLCLYLRSYGLDQKFAKDDKKEVREVRFEPEYVKGKLSRVQDSIIDKTYEIIIKKMMSAQKRSKKLNIGDLSFSSRNELLSKLFVEQLIMHTSEFYVETKTKISRTNYLLLKQQTDSVKSVYDRALNARANMADMTMNSVKQSGYVGLMKKQTDIQVSMNSYIEMKKNLEMLKYSLAKETPLIQIIDKPNFPLKKLELNWYVGILIGAFVGLFSAFALIFILYLKEKIRSFI